MQPTLQQAVKKPVNTLLTFFSALVLMFAIVPDADAKRFGSGGFGKSTPTSPQRAAPTKQTDKNGQNQNQNQAAPTGSRGSLMGGMLGGLLAGGLFAYLLGSGAFEGLQIMDILLLVGLFFLISRLLRPASQSQPQQQTRQAAAAGPLSGLNTEQFLNMGEPDTSADQIPMNLPSDFDADAFIEGALNHYREVQQAWNEGNLELIREYVSPQLFAALSQQRERLMVPPQTEILDLDATIVRADSNATHRELSLLFRGRCKDDLERSEDGIFDFWHLERDMTADNAPWIVVGIEAE